MRNILKSLLAATAFLTLAPDAASALPLKCGLVCDADFSPCTEPCMLIGRPATCGEFGVCAGLRDEPSEPSASVSQDETSQAEASSLTCEEAQQPASAES